MNPEEKAYITHIYNTRIQTNAQDGYKSARGVLRPYELEIERDEARRWARYYYRKWQVIQRTNDYLCYHLDDDARETEEVRSKLEAAEAEVARLRAAMLDAEWSGEVCDGTGCPWCAAWEGREWHKPDCVLVRFGIVSASPEVEQPFGEISDKNSPVGEG